MIKRLQALWNYIWEGETITAYCLNVIVAFIIIKFLVYPGLGLLFGTGFPVVAVVSSSMEHSGSFEDWWSEPALCGNIACSQEQWYGQVGIDENTFKTYFFNNGFNKGDVMVLFGTDPQDLKMGDVIVFQAGASEPIIHRIVGTGDHDIDGHGGKLFATKGDNNPTQLPIETYISQDQVIGRAVFRIPFFGYIKIWFVEFLNLIRF